METNANNLADYIRQLDSTVNAANNIPPSRKKEIEDVTRSLILNIGSRTLPAEVNVKLSNNIGKLKTLAEEEERRGKDFNKDFGLLKTAIWEPFTIKKTS